MRRSLISLAVVIGCLAGAAGAFALPDAAASSEPPVQAQAHVPAERSALAENGMASRASPRRSQSLARIIMAQAYAADEHPARDNSKLRGEQARGSDPAGVPGALVATIFGVFGILVVARRSLR